MFDSPVIELVNTPEPLPSVVFVLAVVGFADVLQHTPRAVTFAPPLSLMFPPLLTVVAVIALNAVVLIVGFVIAVPVVKLISSPYAVPALLVAYARTW